MRRIIIDDNKPFANSLKGSEDDIIYTDSTFSLDDNTNVIINSKSNLRELAEDIISKAISADAVLFININLKISKDKRQELKGIELLIWLRIKGVRNHCVLFSFETLHALLNRQPKYLIATSAGTTFIQLPYDMIKINLTKLNEEEAKDENLKTCLKAAFSISEFRHREANWWGVKQLWDAFNVIYNTEDHYPSSILSKFNLLNNEIAKFLYEYDSTAMQSGMSLQLDEKRLQANSDKRIEIIKLKDDQLKKENISRNFSFGKHRDDDVVSRLSNEINFIKNKIKELDKEILLTGNIDSNEKCFITNMICELHSNNPIILYIDDNIFNGWQDAVDKILSTKIIPFNPDKKFKDDIIKLYEGEEDGVNGSVKSLISSIKPTLIMLDLRLFDEAGANIDIRNLSGNILLKLIIRDFLEIPVLITTASNKMISYNELIKSGAEAFWIKEGLDEHKTSFQTIENYLRLVFLIKHLHDKEYQYLKKLVLIFKKINGDSWWCAHEWINGEKTVCEVEDVKIVLKQCISLYRSFLHKYHLGYALNEEVEIMFFLTGLLNKFGIIVELIHGIKDEEDYKTINTIITTTRCDLVGGEIREKRNKASHVSSITLTKEFFFDTIDLLENYLLKPLIYIETIINEPLISIESNKIKIHDISNQKEFLLSPPTKGVKKKSHIFNNECAIFAIMLSKNEIKIKHSIDNKCAVILNQNNIGSKIRYNTNNQNNFTMQGEMGLLVGNIFLFDNKINIISKRLKMELVNNPSKKINVQCNQSIWDINESTNTPKLFSKP